MKAIQPGVTRQNVGREVLAGITLLAIALPLNIGYAQIAGLPPTAGLYALVIPSVVFALLASSRHLVAAAQPPAPPPGVTQSQINIVGRERSEPRSGSDSQPKSGRRKIRRNLSPDVAT